MDEGGQVKGSMGRRNKRTLQGHLETGVKAGGSRGKWEHWEEEEPDTVSFKLQGFRLDLTDEQAVECLQQP